MDENPSVSSAEGPPSGGIPETPILTPKVEEPVVVKDPESFVSSRPKGGDRAGRLISLKKIGRVAASITSIIVLIFLSVVIVLLVIFLSRELREGGYYISEFNVPEYYDKKGFYGAVVAHRIQDEVNQLVETSSYTWSLRRREEYAQTSNKTQVQVEVGGIGFSPDALIRYVKQAFGIPTKNISGEIIQGPKDLKMIIRVTGHGPIYLDEPIDDKDENEPLERLIKQGAREIVKLNNPLLMGIYYSGKIYSLEDLGTDSMAIIMYKQAIWSMPDQAADAYAWWARSIWHMNGDTTLANSKLKKALKLDQKNALAYRFWGEMKFDLGDFESGEKLLLKSLSLDSTAASTWASLGQSYVMRSGDKDKEAERCFRNAIKLDPKNNYHRDLAELLFVEGKFQSAYELYEYDMTREGSELSPVLKIAILDSHGDSLLARELSEQYKKLFPGKWTSSRIYFISFSEQLSKFALILEAHKNVRPQSLYYARMASEIDPRNCVAYTTMAECYGLEGNGDLFYSNLEKALSLGCSPADLKGKPYADFSGQERYKNLAAKFSHIKKVALDTSNKAK